jgi:hypothetical protein
VTDPRVQQFNGVSGQVASTAANLMNTLGIFVQKAFLTNLDTGESKDFLFNPDQLEEVFGVKYAFHESVGMSHARPQAVVGLNARWTLNAIFDQLQYGVGSPAARLATSAAGAATGGIATIPSHDGGGLLSNGPSDVEDWRNFILSLCSFQRVPAGGGNKIRSQAPTVIHFEWPGFISTSVRIETAKFTHTMFRSISARPRIFTASLSIFEDPAERLYSDDVRKNGTLRPWAASDSHVGRNGR